MKMLEYSHLNMLMAIKPMSNPIDDHPIDQTLYRQLIGSLQYLTFTRQGIVYAINKVYQQFQSPIESNMQVVKVF